ncbi:MAG: S24 family peptidase [Chloroflexota bacterium]
MGRIEKTVFISYRRTDISWALAIYQYLTMHGYDVFIDFQSIPSGNFEKVIIENIKARAHFLVILTPSALDRCNNPTDWLRKEIEQAIDEKRNIIPLMMEGFGFDSPAVTRVLTGKLATLPKINALPIYSTYFFEGMDKLRNQYLNVALSEIPLYPISNETSEITENQKLKANKEKPVNKDQLQKQESEYKQLRIPILGPIAAGLHLPVFEEGVIFETESEAHIVEIARSALPIPTNELNNLFALEVRGDSMTDAMINDGDVVILKPATSARNGEMAAIWFPETNETTLKYFFKEIDGYRLQPGNPDMAPILVSIDVPLEIKGRVIMVIRKVDTLEK